MNDGQIRSDRIRSDGRDHAEAYCVEQEESACEWLGYMHEMRGNESSLTFFVYSCAVLLNLARSVLYTSAAGRDGTA